MRRCGFLTMENPDGFFVYDHLTVEPLRDLGWEVVDVPWSRPSCEWRDLDAVVIRSPWDYQDAPDRFLETLSQIERAGTPLFNPLHICRWNLHKTYLQDLERRGIPIVPTFWSESLDFVLLEKHFSSLGTSCLVVKPTIGANADGVFVVKRQDELQFDQVVAEYSSKSSMVQPFLSSIQATGEYSLFYFGGNYSHAILKHPKLGDFRVQEEHGGTIETTRPTARILKVGDRTIEAIGETLLYARVDIVLLDDGCPAVSELELIEPSLYFPYDSESPRRFSEALDAMSAANLKP